MKKILAIIGAFVTIGAIAAAVAVWLNKLRISLSVESIDDEYEEDGGEKDIDISIEGDKKADLEETAKAVEDAIEDMLDETDGEIEVEITAEEDKE